VGFALEDKRLRERAEKKQKEKKLDMIIANSVAAIGADKSTVEIKERSSGWVSVKNASKGAIARRIISLAEGLCE
jgi:phosphopantothenoylcysteine synthetase/decarboxylase